MHAAAMSAALLSMLALPARLAKAFDVMTSAPAHGLRLLPPQPPRMGTALGRGWLAARAAARAAGLAAGNSRGHSCSSSVGAGPGQRWVPAGVGKGLGGSWPAGFLGAGVGPGLGGGGWAGLGDAGAGGVVGLAGGESGGQPSCSLLCIGMGLAGGESGGQLSKSLLLIVRVGLAGQLSQSLLPTDGVGLAGGESGGQLLGLAAGQREPGSQQSGVGALCSTGAPR